MPLLEERVETLENVLTQFIVNNERTLRHLQEELLKFKEQSDLQWRRFQDEMKAFKDEMQDFKDEMREFKDKMELFSKETKEEARQRNKDWSNLAKKMGTLVEDLIAPALRPVLSKYFGCEVNMEGQRMFRRKDGDDYEIDAIAVCEDRVFMVEARSTPRLHDIEDFVEKAKKFFYFFPEHHGKKLSIIFGSITFREDVIEQASKKGIYVLAWREWEYMDILNFDRVREALNG